MQSGQVVFSLVELCITSDVQPISTDELESQYSDIASHTLHIITAKGISPSDFRQRLLSLPVKPKHQHRAFLQQLLPQISAASVDYIWCKLEFYWDFLNYTLLEHLVNKFGDDTLKESMLRYKDSLSEFRHNTRLCDFARHFKDQVNKCFVGQELMKKLEVKFDKKWEDCTLEDLEKWKESITEKLLLPSYVLTLETSESGCVSVTWAIPAMFAESVMDMDTTHMREFCVERGILSLRINGREYVSIDMGSSSNQEEYQTGIIEDPKGQYKPL